MAGELNRPPRRVVRRNSEPEGNRVALSPRLVKGEARFLGNWGDRERGSRASLGPECREDGVALHDRWAASAAGCRANSAQAPRSSWALHWAIPAGPLLLRAPRPCVLPERQPAAQSGDSLGPRCHSARARLWVSVGCGRGEVAWSATCGPGASREHHWEGGGWVRWVRGVWVWNLEKAGIRPQFPGNDSLGGGTAAPGG